MSATVEALAKRTGESPETFFAGLFDFIGEEKLPWRLFRAETTINGSKHAFVILRNPEVSGKVEADYAILTEDEYEFHSLLTADFAVVE